MTESVEDPDESSRRLLIQSMAGHLPYLRRYAVALTRNRADADDLLQDAVVRAIQKIDTFQAGTHLRSWMLTILHNIFIDTCRRRLRTSGVDETDGSGIAPERLRVKPPQEFRVQIQELERAINSLPPAQRSTLMLATLEGLDYQNIASITGVPLGTVRSRLSRARSTLQNVLTGTYKNEARRPQDRAAAGELCDPPRVAAQSSYSDSPPGGSVEQR